MASSADPTGLEGFGTDAVKDRGTGFDHDLAAARAEPAGSVEIEAEFDALGVEATRPIKVSLEWEVVGFEAESQVAERSEQGGPAGGN